MKRLTIVLALAAAHLVLTWFVFLRAVGFTVTPFADAHAPTFTQSLFEKGATVLLAPLPLVIDQAAGSIVPGPGGYLPFVLNSLLWAVVLYAAIRFARHHRLKPKGATP